MTVVASTMAHCRCSAEEGRLEPAKGFEPPRRPFGRSGSEDSEGSIALEFTAGAGEGIRTLDPNLGKVVLYP